MSQPLSELLDPEHIHAFQQDGVTLLRGAVDSDALDAITRAVEGLIAAPSRHGGSLTPADRPGMFFQDRHLFPQRPEFAAFLTDLPLAALAARAMDSNTVRAFYEQVFVKDPGTEENFVWHQDRPYWNVDGQQICSTWLALTAADVASSALEFVRGSHRWNKTFRPEFPGLEGHTPEELEQRLWRGVREYVESFDEVCPQFEDHPSEYDIVSFAVEPGDVLLFDYRIVHRSGPNAGAARRAAVSWRWLGDDAVWAPKFGADPIVRPKDTSLNPGDLIDDDAVFPIAYRHPDAVD